MQIRKISMFSGKEHIKEIDVTPEQMNQYHHGAHLHVAFPNLSADDREFIHTGCTKEEWDDIFPKERNDEEYEQLSYDPDHAAQLMEDAKEL